MQNPKPFAIYQPVPGQSAKPLFVNHAYSLEQARARSSRQQYPARPSWSARSRETEQTGDPRYPQRPSRHGLRVSDAEGDQAGLEREAMEFAAELMHTSKPMHTMLCNRLLIICHEDLDTIAAPQAFPFVSASVAASQARYSSKMGEARLMIGNCIRIMCRAPKSRAGCRFAAAIGLRSSPEDFAPTIPDWANDQHTLTGRKLGRGLDHFRAEGAKLVPPPTGPDPYEDEADRLWALKRRGK